MDRNVVRGAAEKARVILPVILRITFCLVMWTLGAMTMTIAEARTGSKAFTKKEESNPQLTRWAALTTPPGVFSDRAESGMQSPVLRAISGRVVASI